MSKRILDKIIVIDVESTCTDKKDISFKNEIIEIGICLLDISSGEITENTGIYVKNEYSPITPFCTELTGITQKIINEKGIYFKDACNTLIEKYNSLNRVWGSYGYYDLNQFNKDCKNKDVKNPFIDRHINIKTLFALKNRLTKEVGMDSALKIKNISLEGIHHRGKDDAYNIAKILKTII